MLHKLVQAIPILLLLTTGSMAQVQRESGPSLQQRARELEPLIVESARRYGIDPRVVRIVCFLESRYRSSVVSPKGARGLMQFMPETARRYGLTNPHDPKASIDAAAHYLHDLLMKFHGRLDLALASYNAGEGAVGAFQTGRPLVLASGKIINPLRLITGGVPPYRETQAYVKSGIALYMNGQLVKERVADFPPRTKKSMRRDDAGSISLDSLNKNKPSLTATDKTRSLFIEVQ